MDIKSFVEQRVGVPIPLEWWREAARGGFVRKVKEAKTREAKREALEDLIAHFQWRLEQAKREPQAQSRHIFSHTALARAFAAIQAREVSNLAILAKQGDTLYPLRVLREKYLQGVFVPVDGVQGWLQHHLTDGQPLPSTRLTLTPEAETRVLQALQQGQPVEIQPSEFVRVEQYCETLHYGGRVYPVRFDGALWWLWQASRALMRLCGWTESDAIEFALCNRVPEGLALEYRAEWSLSAGLAFLSVRVPLYTPPEEVAQLYAQVRRELKHKARYKGVSEFTARFVHFVECYRLERPEATWKEVIAEWNRQNPAEMLSPKQAHGLITHYNRTLALIAQQVLVEAWGS
ncbi:hypothetical protein GBSOP10_10213 [Armatimonadetes bacterium GBS]|jgi:hypothetical protein|nr:hypothetical protein HRbin14_01206 [bacterium HR14]CUU02660.1 hypothetical protein GBSOP10_10213 [Armatimonadetes bacterium GBS]CUU38583.1 hypothetical protein GXSOP10_14026 [Armatimonadetes bacterium GXS]